MLSLSLRMLLVIIQYNNNCTDVTTEKTER